MSNFKIKGGKELMTVLSSLPAKIERNIMRSALNQGAKVIQAEAKANVPVESGELRDSIKRSTRAERGRIKSNVTTKLFYARFVEFGTAAHQIKGKDGGYLFFKDRLVRSVNHPGARAKPFLRPALDAKAADAIRAVGEQIGRRLTKVGIEAPPLEVEE